MKFLFTVAAFCTLLFTSCSKTDLVDTVNSGTKDNLELRILIEKHLDRVQFEDIKWSDMSTQILTNRNTFYTLTFQSDKHKKLSVLKVEKEFLLQLDTWKVDSLGVTYTQKNVKTQEVIVSYKPANESLTTNSALLDDITLEGVVVFSYRTQGNNWLNFIIYNQLVQGWIPTGGAAIGYSSIYESLEPGDVSGQMIYLGPVLEFVDDEEAAGFFSFLDNMNSLEKALAALYPVEALMGYRNSLTADAKARGWAISNNASGDGLTDGRGDALRHAYWNALNASDMGSSIAQLFADAHEYGRGNLTTNVEAMARMMDLHNNSWGRQYAVQEGWHILTSANTIWDFFMSGAANVDLKYMCFTNNNTTVSFNPWNVSCP